MIICVILDDEPLALDLLSDHIRQVPDMKVVLATTDPLAAIAFLREQPADLLFLDMKMPKLSGLEVLQLVGERCQVVVTSAYSEYAIHGFEHHVTDYLLKPVTFARFLTAISRVKERLQPKGAVMPVADFAYFKVGQLMQRVNFAELLHIEGLKDHVLLHLPTRKIKVLQTMKGEEELLPPVQFVRVHRSYIVAVARIEQIHRQHIVVSGTFIPVGQSYRESFLKQVFNG